MAVSREAATAQMAFCGPRLLCNPKNCALYELSFFRLAAQAHCTSMVLSHGAPLRRRVRLRLPALSFWPGHIPAQATRWPAVAKRLMSVPISDRIVNADSRLTPGMVTS